jgi:hypothetical protein
MSLSGGKEGTSGYWAGDRLQIHPVRDGLLVGVLILIASVLGTMGYYRWVFGEYEDQEVREKIETVALAAAAVVDGDLHGRLRSRDQEGGSEYSEVIAPLRKMRSELTDMK